MIMCADHHCDVAICGCDPDEQYRLAQAEPKMTNPTLPIEHEGLVERLRELAGRASFADAIKRLSRPRNTHSEVSISATKAVRRELVTVRADDLAMALAAANPQAILSLLDERDEAIRQMSQYAREAGEAKGRLEMSEAAGIVDGWRERAEAAEAERDRLRKALERISYRAQSEPDPDAYADEPPEWAKDCFNDDEVGQCGYCGSWLTVVRPGKSQCDTCSDGRDLGALARSALEGKGSAS